MATHPGVTCLRSNEMARDEERLWSTGRTVHVRKSTVAEPALMALYQALAINPAPGGTKK
jgi:hypothetical protein